jgi:ParE toxin of type II toxin-antitoxin system, parDE
VLLREAAAELDNIWDYVAKDGGSTEIADRLIDSIAERFYLLACHPPSDAAAPPTAFRPLL